MRKTALSVLLGLLLVGVVASAFYVLIPWWARRVVYTASDQRTQFPGSGEVTQKIRAQLLVFPYPTGRPFYAPVEDEETYRSPDYQVYRIEANDAALAYAVGRFVRWETMAGLQDRLMVLADPYRREVTYTYRISLAPSILFGDNPTYLGVENIRKVLLKAANPVEEFREFPLAEVPVDRIEAVIEPGDAVVMIPLYDPPGSVKTDPAGNTLASWLILRRFEGKAALIKEMSRSFVAQSP